MKIVKANDTNIIDVIQYAYKVNLIKEKSIRGFNTNFEVFEARFKRSLKKIDIFVIYEDGNIIGVVDALIDKENKYLEGSGIFTNEEYNEVFSFFIEYLKKEFSGYDLSMSYEKENQTAINAFELMGGVIDEPQYEYTIDTKKYNIESDVILLSNEHVNFSEFHDNNFKNVYWDSTKLKTTDKFEVLIKVINDKVVGEVITTIGFKNTANIFFVAVDEKYRRNGIATELYKKAIENAYLRDIKKITLQVDESNIKNNNLVKKLGFMQTSSNVTCSITKL